MRIAASLLLATLTCSPCFAEDAAVSNWLAQELSGDEAARVGKFANCEFIDQSPACGESVLWEQVIVVKSAKIVEDKGEHRSALSFEQLAILKKSKQAMEPRNVVVLRQHASQHVGLAESTGGARLTGQIPRLVELCNLLAVLRTQLTAVSEKSPWADALRVKYSTEEKELRRLAESSQCSGLPR